MKLVLIHGRDQQGKDSAILKQQWIDTWSEGLAKSGLAIPKDLLIEFPFYGDILNDIVHGGDITSAVEGAVKRGSNGASPESVFIGELLTELAENKGIDMSAIAAKAEVPYTERGPLNWRWVQLLLQAVDEHTSFGNLSIKLFTYDVYLYLTNKAVRKRIDQCVSKVVDETPCVVVGHSLGSIVGYNVLTKHLHQVHRYITVGSPLGLLSVSRKLDSPIEMPVCIRNGWHNAYDERDVVALNPLDKKYFNIDPLIENNNTIDNRTKNRHGIEGYLDDKDTAKIIFDALAG